MPENAEVLVAYGPYNACGTVKHSQSRLLGLESSLLDDGHVVHFEKIKDWDRVELWVNGEMIYKCCITELDYGGDGQLDSNVKDAVQAVKTSF